jgi:hypothetical protein
MGYDQYLLIDEKPDNTIGRPIIPFIKVMDGIIYVLRKDVNGEMLPREYVLVPHTIDDFKSGFS